MQDGLVNLTEIKGKSNLPYLSNCFPYMYLWTLTVVVEKGFHVEDCHSMKIHNTTD